MARQPGLRSVQRLAAFMRREGVTGTAGGRRGLRSQGWVPPSYETIAKHPEVFRRDEAGHYRVRAIDYSPRVMDIVSVERGVARDVVIRSSRDAAKVQRWWTAVQDFAQTGDDSKLAELSERDVSIRSGRTTLQTDLDRLQVALDAGDLDDFMRNYHEGRRR